MILSFQFSRVSPEYLLLALRSDLLAKKSLITSVCGCMKVIFPSKGDWLSNYCDFCFTTLN